MISKEAVGHFCDTKYHGSGRDSLSAITLFKNIPVSQQVNSQLNSSFLKYFIESFCPVSVNTVEQPEKLVSQNSLPPSIPDIMFRHMADTLNYFTHLRKGNLTSVISLKLHNSNASERTVKKGIGDFEEDHKMNTIKTR